MEPGQEPRREGQRDARKVLRDNSASVNGISNIVTWALTTFDCSRQRCLARALRGIDVDPRRTVFEFAVIFSTYRIPDNKTGELLVVWKEIRCVYFLILFTA